MTAKRIRRVADSRSEQTQIVLPQHANAAHRLFGGQLLQWVDVIAAVAARRHAQQEVVTVALDHILFKEPVAVGQTLVLIAELTYVGRTSMEVRVESFVEALEGGRTLVNVAYLVMVAVDGENRPQAVPELEPVTERERREYEVGRERQLARKRTQETERTSCAD